MADTVFEMNGTMLTVKPMKVLDSVFSPIFEEEFYKHMPGAEHVIVDFESVRNISSAGLRVLLLMQQQLDDQDIDMKLIHVNEHIIEVFDLVGFLDVVTVE